MAAPEPEGGLSDTNVADVDAEADPLSGLEPLCHIDEPARIQAGGVLDKDDGATRALAKTGIQLTHRGKQPVCLRRHLTVVMDDQAGDTACETVGELRHHGAAPLVQHI